MSPHLQQFYNDYYAWLMCPDDNGVFSKSRGLCASLLNYAVIHKMNYKFLRKEMRNQFIDEGLDDYYPFSSPAEYFWEIERDICHLNKKRIAWVKAHTSEAVK